VCAVGTNERKSPKAKTLKAKGAKPTRKAGGRKEAPVTRRQQILWIVAACLIPLCLVGFSLFTYGLTDKAWNAVVGYQSPFQYENLESGPATGRPGTGGVLLIIVDGLRLDASRDLATWNLARAGSASVPAGADLSAVAGQPSLSDPAAAVIPSGTSQEIHGVTTNWYEGLLKVDNLFRCAARAGKTTAVVAGKGWVDLYGGTIGQMYKFDDSTGDFDRQVFEQTMNILTGAGPLPDLLVVHFGGVDNASHASGGISAEATAAAATIDGYVGRMLAAYDLTNRTAVLTSDHGHLATGGHGGWEPEVLNVPLVFTGKGVASGTYPAAQQVDLAPTISALMGISPPAETIGTILENVIALPAEDMSRAFIDLGRARVDFTTAYLETNGERLPPSQALSDAVTAVTNGSTLLDDAWVTAVAGDPALAEETAKGAIYLLDKARADVDHLRMGAERRSRATLSLLMVLLPLIPLFYLARNRWANLALGGALLYFALHSVLFFLVRGFRYSLSIFNEESAIKQFFALRMLDAAIVVLVAGLVFGLVAGWRKKYLGPELAEGAAFLSYLVGYGLALQIIFFYYLNSVSFAWFLPNLAWGFKFYADCLQIVPTGIAAVLVVPLALLGAKVAALITRDRPATPSLGAK
jgi:hypothetical protein